MGSFYMESTQINYRRDETVKTVDQKLQELSETSAIDTDIAPVFKSTNTYAPGDMVYYRNKLYVFNVEHTGAWAAADVTATDVSNELSSLKSGLIDVNVALDVPAGTGKNVLPMTLESIKSLNTTGTWNDNAYTINTLVFAVNTDANGRITSIVANGTPSTDSSFVLTKVATLSSSLNGSYILTGCPSGGGSNYNIHIGSSAQDDGSGASFTTPLSGSNCAIRVKGSYAASNLAFYPMIRRADIADATYVPYIPSVESRIEAVESNLSGVFTADLLYEGAPTTAETYEEMNLISGKSITDYLLILFICRQYNNTVAFAIEPRHVFTQQTGDGSRVIFKYGDGALQTVMVYYVSPTKIAVNQKTVDGAIWKTALYGIIKQP